MPVASRWSAFMSKNYTLLRGGFFSLAILPLQLGNDVSKSTANVASYNVETG